MGGVIGLDRAEVIAHFELMGEQLSPEQYVDLMAIEDGFVESANADSK